MIIFVSILVAVVIVATSIAGLAIKVLVRKRGEFKRHCSNVDPYTEASEGCDCEAMRHNLCNERQHHPYQPLDVNEELLKEMNN